jgi:2'-5' RNA ligase
MSKVLAIDVALLPPPEVTRQAIELSASIPAEGSQGLQLDPEHLPHVTLTQQFVRDEELELAFERVNDVLRRYGPLRLLVIGSGKGGHTLWMAIERTPDLVELHERLMEELRGVERPDGAPGAFFGGDARVGDVLWVASYRLKSSFGAFTPHITLGHGAQPPAIEPFAFDATTVAACHLGRFCTCRRVLRHWTLAHPTSR